MTSQPVSPEGYERIKRSLFDEAEGAPPPDPRPRLGKYLVTRKIAQGGMGIVFEAEDPELRRRVALKVLKDAEENSKEVARLHREAEIAAQLHHPNIVAIHEVGMVRDEAGFSRHFIAMDYVEGATMYDLLRGERADRPKLLQMLEQISRAVDYAHSKGIVHRDLKPSNVLVEVSGRVLLTDFGIARAENFTRLTKSQSVMGTPQYMPPEQVEGRLRDIGPRTDVYALGAMLYEILTGRPPFVAPTPAKIYEQILRDDPVPPRSRRPSVERKLEVICLKALEKSPARRYATALEFAEELRRVREGEPIQARPTSWGTRVGRFLARRRTLGTTALVCLIVAAVPVLLLWRKKNRELAQERERAQRREQALREIGSLWTDIVVAKQRFHNSAEDPRQVRAKIQEGIDRVDAFLLRNPGLPQAHYVRARGQLYLGRWKEAERSIRKAIELDAEFAPAHALLAQVLLERYYYVRVWEGAGAERERKSQSLLQEAREQVSKAGNPTLEPWGLTRTREDEVAEILLQALESAYIKEDLAAAGKLLLDADARAPSEQYRNWLGNWHESLEGNIAWQSKALECMPHFARAYAHRANARDKKKDLDGAVADYSKAIAVDPEYAHAYNNRGHVRHRRGDDAGALADYTRAIEADPEFDWAYFNRGSLRLKLRELEGALADLTRAIVLSPRNPDAYCQRGTVYRDLREYEKSIEDYTKAVDIDPKHVAALANRGVAYELLKRFPEAARDYEEALRIAGPAWPMRGEIEKQLLKVRPR